MAKSLSISVPAVKNVEDILENLGGFGRFQFLILVLLLSLEIPTAFVVFSPVFTGAEPKEWTCDNLSVSKSNICTCNGTLGSSTSSIVSEWGLVCDLSWVSDFITTLQMVGMIFGNGIAGQCADWYGRRWTFLGSVVVLASSTIMSAASPNLYVYSVARFFAGAGFSSYVGLTGTYAMEFMTPRWRVICASVGPFGEGIMLLGVLGYYFQNSWRNLLWVSVLPFSLIFIIFPFLPESPRWLLRNRNVEKAHEVFSYIAKVNKKSPIDLELLIKISAEESNEGETKMEKFSYLSLLRPPYAVTTFCLCMIWNTWGIMYFGISYNIKNVGGNPYMNVIFMGLSDALGYPCSFLVNSVLTRRQSLATFMTMSAVFLVSLAVVMLIIDVTDKQVLVLTLCLLGKFTAAGARASARTLTGESFPTAVRSMGMGIIGISASVISLIAPPLAYIGASYPSIPLFTFAGCSLAGAMVSFLLKETKGTPLKEGMRRRSRLSSIANTIRRLSMGGISISGSGK